MEKTVTLYSSLGLGLGLAAAASAGLGPAQAQTDPYHITATEKAACLSDAERLCSGAYPDERKLLSCMLANKASLTSICLVAFNAGLKRRHLVSR